MIAPIKKCLSFAAGIVFFSAPASAQNEGVAAEGVHFRFGISTGGGLLLASAQGPVAQILPGEAWDLDVRVGVQFNRIFAMYAQPSLAFADRISIAAGGGLAGVPGEPIGAGVHFRVGTYPFVKRLQDTFIGSAVMVGLETRAYSLSASGSTYVGGLIMLAVGYERF